MDDKYLNDKLNYILLISKRNKQSLTFKEGRELKRIIKKGLNVGVDDIRNYISILRLKSYVTINRTTVNGITTDEIIVTEIGLKALKYNHLLSESKKERSKARFANIQRIAIIISIPASLIAMGLSVRSCSKEANIDNIENRIDKIEQKLDVTHKDEI